MQIINLSEYYNLLFFSSLNDIIPGPSELLFIQLSYTSTVYVNLHVHLRR